MAFNSANICPSSALANSDFPRLFSYTTTDAKGTVVASDYFLSYYQHLNAGDVIICNTSTGSTPDVAVIHVVASSSSTVTTAYVSVA